MRKFILLSLILFLFQNFYSQETKPTYTPEELVQQQVEGYNNKDIVAFLEPYSENIEIYMFPNSLENKGKSNMKPTYVNLFKNYPELHCKIIERIIIGNKVIDKESITWQKGSQPTEAVAIYEIENNKIQKVFFVY